jgi:hypothetical protein
MELFYYKRSQWSAAALLPCSAGKEASSKAYNPTFLFKKKSEEPTIDPKMADDDPVDPDDPQPGNSFHQ